MDTTVPAADYPGLGFNLEKSNPQHNVSIAEPPNDNIDGSQRAYQETAVRETDAGVGASASASVRKLLS